MSRSLTRSSKLVYGSLRAVGVMNTRQMLSQLSSQHPSRLVTPLSISPIAQKAKMVGIMVAGGTVASTACSYCSMAATSSTTTTEEVPVVLYQYEPCPYCCKVKAVLDYLSIPYHVVEVNPLTKKETKAFTDYKKVPVAKINGEVVVDSSAIIAKLRDFAKEQQPKNYNEGGVSFEEEEKWRSWVDQRLILLMPPNIYRTIPEALAAFDYCLTEGKFTQMERMMSKYAGAAVMYLIAKKSKKKYEIEDERQALYEAVDAWLEAIGPQRAFLGGKEPNMADLSVFGVIRSVQGLDTFEDLMQNTQLKPWFTRMTEKVGPTSRVSME